MFGLLKKKLAGFTEKLKKNIEKKAPTQEQAEKKEVEKLAEEKKEKTISKKDKPEKKQKREDNTVSSKEQAEIDKLNAELEEELKEFKEEAPDKSVGEKDIREEVIEEKVKETPKKEELVKKNEIKKEDEEVIENEDEINEDNTKEERVIVEKERDIDIKRVDEDKRELKAHIGAGGKLKSFFTGKVEIKEKDISDLLFELELSLIESDVEQDAARDLVEKIKSKLTGEKVNPKHLDDFLKKSIKEILIEMMSTQKINILEEIKKSKKENKPFVILMLGPNGAGKTTSIAKLTKYFQKNKLSCVWAAGDTFRSGAIDQLQVHADKLNVKVIKQQYGADPAAVAFDAIKSAEAGKNDVVIIDTAGRQETNKNLMEELKKIQRVAKPNLKIYVGEAFTGQGLLEMANEFDKTIGINGFILTKIDTDAKGGTAISLLYKLKKPILFVGTGQEYEDFREFTPEFVLDRII